MSVFKKIFYAMTTACEVHLFHDDHAVCEAVFANIHAEIERLTRKYNFYAATSWLNQSINQRSVNQVLLDQETADILLKVRRHSEHVGGMFDVCSGTYHHAIKGAKNLAEVAAIYEELSPFTGLSAWQIEGKVLSFSHPKTRFDLGGVIKEYAVDCSVSIAQQHGIDAGLINYGGDLRCWGKKPDGETFTAAVSQPDDDRQVAFALKLHNHALTTSGHNARARPLADGMLSHIRQQHWHSRYISATVISAETLVSGIYSTALLIDDSIKLPANSYAYCVDDSKTLHQF